MCFRVLLTAADVTLVYGRRYGLVGRNGLGKTTLLRMISRYVKLHFQRNLSDFVENMKQGRPYFSYGCNWYYIYACTMRTEVGSFWTIELVLNIVHMEKIVLVYSLWIKPTDALNSNFIGITTVHVSGSLSAHHQEFLALHRLWYLLCSCDDRSLPGVGWNCKQFHPAPGSKRSSQLHKRYQSRCTAKNSWWWAERLPKTCTAVIPIKLEFSASVGFIHKESVTICGHTIVKMLVYIGDITEIT